MYHGPDELLQRRCAKGQGLVCGSDVARAAPGGEGNTMGGCLTLELSLDEGVVFLSDAAEEFDDNDEEDDADACCGEHALVSDVP